MILGQVQAQAATGRKRLWTKEPRIQEAVPFARKDGDSWEQLACLIANRAEAVCRTRVVHVVVDGVVLNSVCGGVAYSMKVV
jgi:hypothetical protein